MVFGIVSGDARPYSFDCEIPDGGGGGLVETALLGWFCGGLVESALPGWFCGGFIETALPRQPRGGFIETALPVWINLFYCRSNN